MSKDLVMHIIMKASDRASGAMRKVASAGGGLSGRVDALLRKLEKQNAVMKDVKGYAALQQQMQQAEAKSGSLARKIGTLTAQIKAAGSPTAKQAAEMARLEDASQKAAERQTELAERSRRLSYKLKQAGFDTRDFAREQVRLTADAAKTRAELERQGAALERVHKAHEGIGRATAKSAVLAGWGMVAQSKAQAIGRGLGVQVKAAVEEEDAMLGIIKQVQGLKNADNSLNHAEIAKVRAEIRGLSQELPVATTEIMAMYEAGARMDVPRQELGAYVKTAAVAATAFDAEDMGQLAENLGRINKNFKLSAEQGRALADVINYLDDNSLSKGADIIEYMNRVSGSMGLAKISDKNTAALGSTLLTSGVDASTSANAVSSLFTRLSTAPDMKPVREALTGLGLDAKAIQKGMVEDANATVLKVMEAVKKMPKEQQAGFLKGLAGGEYNKVFAALISNTEEWRRQLALANSEEAKGSMMREFETRAGALSSKWQIFKNQLFGTAALMGQTLFPAIQDLLQIGERWLTNISKWVQENPKIAGALMKAAAVTGILAGALAAAAAAAAAVLLPLAAMNAAWVHAAAAVARAGGGVLRAVRLFGLLKSTVFSLGRILMANPMLLAFTLVAAAVYLLWRNWERVKEALVSGWQRINQAFADNPVLNFIFPFIGVARLIINNWDGIAAFFSSLWQRVSAAFSEGVSAAGEWLAGMQAKAAEVFGRIMETVRSLPLVQYLTEKFNQALAALGLLKEQFFTIGSAMIGRLLDGISAMWEKARAKIAQMGAYVRGAFANIGRVFDGGAPSPVRGFSRGGYTGAGGVNEAAGIVHRGEVVFSQADVRRFGGWQAVEALRRGGASALAGIKGILPASERRAPSGFAGSLKAAAPGGDHIVININGSGMDAQAVAREVARQLDTRSRERQSRARSSYYDQD